MRHLLYHIWPKRAASETWKLNLDHLKRRWALFTGKKVIAVATCDDSCSVEDVQEYMRGYECEWQHIRNNPSMREVASFLPLFESVEGLPGYTFYAQGKGVTKPINNETTVHEWASAMYEINLDYWPLVQDALQLSPIVGAFKKCVLGFHDSRSDWHYSGSFFWFKNAELFRRMPRLPNILGHQYYGRRYTDWRTIEPVWFGIESFPSMLFNRSEAGCLFHHRDGAFNLYNRSYWDEVLKELAIWKQENIQSRSSTLLLTDS